MPRISWSCRLTFPLPFEHYVLVIVPAGLNGNRMGYRQTVVLVTECALCPHPSCKVAGACRLLTGALSVTGAFEPSRDSVQVVDVLWNQWSTNSAEIQ